MFELVLCDVTQNLMLFSLPPLRFYIKWVNVLLHHKTAIITPKILCLFVCLFVCFVTDRTVWNPQGFLRDPLLSNSCICAGTAFPLVLKPDIRCWLVTDFQRWKNKQKAHVLHQKWMNLETGGDLQAKKGFPPALTGPHLDVHSSVSHTHLSNPPASREQTSPYWLPVKFSPPLRSLGWTCSPGDNEYIFF